MKSVTAACGDAICQNSRPTRQPRKPASPRVMHRRLWKWLAEHPGASKQEWPGWPSKVTGPEYRTFNALYPDAMRNLCFACVGAYDRELRCTNCKKCPINWEENTIGLHNCLEAGAASSPVEGSANCLKKDSIYYKWRLCHFSQNNELRAEAVKLALQIRDAWK